MPEDAPLSLQEIVASAEAETRAMRDGGAYPADLVRELAAPLEDPPEQAPEALAFIPSARPLRSAGVLGPAVVLTKRITRRLLAWYVAPSVADQSRFNEATVQLIRRLERRIERLEAPWRPSPVASAGHRELANARAALLRSLGSRGDAVLLMGDVAGLDRAIPDADFVTAGGDPMTCLQRMKPASLRGIYLAAVLSRLSARDLLDIVPCAVEKLAPQGWLVADAPDTRAGSVDDDVRFQRRIAPETVRLLFDACGLRPGKAARDGAALAPGWFAVAGWRD